MIASTINRIVRIVVVIYVLQAAVRIAAILSCYCLYPRVAAGAIYTNRNPAQLAV